MPNIFNKPNSGGNKNEESAVSFEEHFTGEDSRELDPNEIVKARDILIAQNIEQEQSDKTEEERKSAFEFDEAA
jgi:hypothetical protein